MNIFIVGSYRENTNSNVEFIKNKGLFKNFCQALGKKIAQAGDNVILCSESPNTADPYIVEGIDDVGGTTVKVFHPTSELNKDNSMPYKEEGSKHPNVQFDYTNVDGGWRVTHLKALLEADVVVAIGGSLQGTYKVIYSAEVLRKPVLLVPTFGGAAKEALSDFKYYYEQLEIYDELIQARDGGKLHALVEKLYKKNPFQKETTKSKIGRIALGVFAVFVFCLMFWKPLQWVAPHIAVLLMFSSSAIAGGVLRKTLRIEGAIRTPWDINLLNHLLLTLLLCFGIILVSIAHGFFLHAELVTLETVGDVTRIGVGLSVMSFIVALFIEKAYQWIERKGKSLF